MRTSDGMRALSRSSMRLRFCAARAMSQLPSGMTFWPVDDFGRRTRPDRRRPEYPTLPGRGGPTR